MKPTIKDPAEYYRKWLAKYEKAARETTGTEKEKYLSAVDNYRREIELLERLSKHPKK